MFLRAAARLTARRLAPICPALSPPPPSALGLRLSRPRRALGAALALGGGLLATAASPAAVTCDVGAQRDALPLKSLLQELRLDRYLKGLDDEGFAFAYELVEATPPELAAVCQAVGMKRQEIVRLERALAQRRPKASASQISASLITAAQRGKDGEIKHIIESNPGCDVDSTEGQVWGTTPLKEAANYNHPEAVRLLLGAGADPNKGDRNGETALMKCAQRGYTDIVSILLEGGADHKATDKDGKSALDWARAYGQFHGRDGTPRRGTPAEVLTKWAEKH